MIEVATAKDSHAVQRIWKTCFGDGDAYIRFFVKTHLSAGRCLVNKENGKPVSMLFLLPSRCFYRGEQRAVQYIYAAATLPLYRRRGLMEALLAYAHDLAVEKGLLFTCLKPASEPLYRYYGKRGYQSAFHGTRKCLPPTAEAVPFSFETAEPDWVFEKRTRAFPVGVQWGRDLFDFVLREWKMEEGETLVFPGGYCLVRKNGERVFCKEVVSETYSLSLLATALCARFHLPETEFRLPWDGISTLQEGMIRPADKTLDVRAFEAARPYFNLMLD